MVQEAHTSHQLPHSARTVYSQLGRLKLEQCLPLQVRFHTSIPHGAQQLISATHQIEALICFLLLEGRLKETQAAFT